MSIIEMSLFTKCKPQSVDLTVDKIVPSLFRNKLVLHVQFIICLRVKLISFERINEALPMTHPVLALLVCYTSLLK